MYIALHVVCCNFQFNNANIKKNEIDWLIINIQLNIDVKANAHIIFLIVRQVKIDDKQIIRRENANVASRFLYCQYVIFFDFQIDQQWNHDVVFVISNIIINFILVVTSS